MCESGKFYGMVIDPVLKQMRQHVTRKVKYGQSVVDIACGTGAQVLELAEKASNITGIDYSNSMIQFAKKAAQNQNYSNVEFILGNACDLSAIKKNSFDIAIMTLALHQFLPELHTPILNEMKRVANKIIIVDYAVPLPNNYIGIGSRIAEFIAGKEHNTNFKNYYKLGGLNNILKSNNFTIEESDLFAKGAFQLIVCSAT